MDTTPLEALGLSHTESVVYLALLELDSATASKIAERSGTHRRTVYDTLETLMEKGLASFVIEANRKWYHAENPRRLVEIADENVLAVKTLLPELERKRTSPTQSQATMYRGIKGMKNVLTMVLMSNTPIYSFGSSGGFKKTVGVLFYERWLRDLRMRKTMLHIILSSSQKRERYPPNVIPHYIPEPYQLPSSVTIFDDAVVLLIFTPQPLAFVIRSKEAAKSYRWYFNLLSKNSA